MKPVELFHKGLNEGGFTVTNLLQLVDNKGFFVSVPHKETRIPVSLLTPSVFKELLKSYQKEFGLIGFWVDETDDTAYFDVSILIHKKEEAILLGREWEQKAIFDNALKEVVTLI